MKRNLEQNFKEAFEQYELPYNPTAWDALNKKLDQQIATPKSKTGNGFKWLLGTFALVGTLASIFLISNNAAPKSSEVATINNTTEVLSTPKEMKNDYASTQENSQQTAVNSIPKTVTPVENEDNSKVNANDKTNPIVSKNGPSVTPIFKEEVSAELPVVEKQPKNEVTNTIFNFPAVPSSICQATEKSIENTNKTDLVIIDPKGNKTVIKPNTTKKFNFVNTGDYVMQSSSNNSLKSIISVKDAPQVDFHVADELVYENGIPTTNLVASENGSKYEWKVNNQLTNQTKAEFTGHFYKKGTYVIELTQTNQAGCKSTISKDVRIDENYNLLAPNGFMPLSSDTRKNKFIPFALTVRKTEFRMVIIEPRSGKVLFETNLVEGWDGIDPNTQQLVQENNAYIWKVILANPEKGEPREYSGIVTRL